MKDILELNNSEKILLFEKIWDNINQDEYKIPESHQIELDKRLKKITGIRVKIIKKKWFIILPCTV